MAILSTLLKKGIRLKESLEQDYSSPIDLQRETLKELMIHSRETAIAKRYNFNINLSGFSKTRR